MDKKGNTFINEKGRWLFLGFALPVVILILAYGLIGIYPGSEKSIMASDSFSQLSNFFASYNTMLKGEESIFYTWYASFGLNYWSFISYYLGGIFTPLVYFFDNQQMPEFLYFLTLLKFGCSGLAFCYYSLETFKLPKWGPVGLSISYSLMGFTLAFSEMVMWLDTFIYLPLIILGIHRVLEKRKPALLFVSYVLLFISNFYLAFMAGFFTFLYFCARALLLQKGQRKQPIVMYLTTSLLAGGASMAMVLPAILDLKNNGEAMSKVQTILTDGTGPLDLIAKNFVGVYDTTMFGAVPFVFVGLLSLILCLYFFVSRQTTKREKLVYGGLFAVLILSFYWEPLNLFWHGLHTPNMFPFRYSFGFSFLVIALAGYGWERLDKQGIDRLLNNVFILVLLFTGVKLVGSYSGSYTYVTILSFGVTVILCFGYLGLLFLQKKRYTKWLGVLFVLVISVESGINTYGIFSGIEGEWSYPTVALYNSSHKEIKNLVAQTKAENESFYRMETLDPVTKNDSLAYGYSGVSMFSSIRNRHSLSYLHDLGYRSWDTNLQISYLNNTLLMDVISGIKYNLTKEDMHKFGFTKKAESGEYALYENTYAMPLGVLTDEQVYEEGKVQSQTSLFNQLAKKDFDYYTFIEPEMVELDNVELEESEGLETYRAEDEEKHSKKIVTWEAVIPAGKQAYLSLYPYNYEDLETANIELKVNGTSQKTRINMTGQYYDLGMYEEETTIEFSATFTGGTVFSFLTPDIALLDIDLFEEAATTIQEKGVAFTVSGRTAKAEVVTDEEQVLFTTIPYDQGWTVSVDGKQVEIPRFKDAFLTVTIPTGTHTVAFIYLPLGLKTGILLTVSSLLLFSGYLFVLKRRRNDPFYQASVVSVGGNGPKPAKEAEKTDPSEFSKLKEASIEGEKPAKEQFSNFSAESNSNKFVQEKDPFDNDSLMTSFTFSDRENEFGFQMETKTEIKEELLLDDHVNEERDEVSE
ncbi:YfhO family protein [Candidatus Enterococcus clewellii]|uniref:ABC transporter permease n=1 Tax=Candidatus Enterococcus clewellii TaxID=1834193 RepID=A0AAQ3Y1W4_9ENTE